MDVFLWIVAVTTLGGVLSVLAAGLLLTLSDRRRDRLVPALVSFAIGALLGAAFLALLPHAMERGDVGVHAVTATVLLALLMFFLLERMVLWRHCHAHDCEVHGGAPEHTHVHTHGHFHAVHVDRARAAAAGSLILVGDSIHNFVDGVLIAAAFMTDVQLGIVTSLAVFAHEIPQELGDFAILLHSGFSRARALLYNLLTSLTMVIGAVIAYFFLSFMQAIVPYVLAVAAASFIYIAVADLIPGLHRRPEMSATLQQVLLIGAGVGLMFVAEHFAH